MTVSITPCWRSALRSCIQAWLAAVLLLAAPAFAGSIEPQRAALKPDDDGWALSAEFTVDLGSRLEEAVTRGVPLYFALEFDLTRARWYWANEHVASRRLDYKLAYNALTREYRLSVGGLHQNFSSLNDALSVISRVAALHVVDRADAKPGETYAAALRLSLDKSQLPKPLQVDALANRDWQVETKILRWNFTVPAAEAK
jgi:hypothetical protein